MKNKLNMFINIFVIQKFLSLFKNIFLFENMFFIQKYFSYLKKTFFKFLIVGNLFLIVFK